MARKAPDTELSEQELAFATNYLNPEFGFNGTKAAIAAGYSPRTAAQQASRLLNRAKVRDWMAARQEKRLASADSKAEKVITELERIAHQDIRKVVTFRSVQVNAIDPDDDDSDRDEDDEDDEGALAGAEGKAEALHIVDLRLRDSDQLDDDAAAAIQSIQSDGKGGFKLKFHSKLDALGILAKHHGLLQPDEVKVTASDELIKLLDERRDRAIGRRKGEGEDVKPRRPPVRPGRRRR